MKRVFVISLVPCFLISGCVGHYKQPSDSEPHAVVNVMGSINQGGLTGTQHYWAYENSQCVDTDQGGVLLAASYDDDSKSFLVLPDKRVFLQVMSSGAEAENHAVFYNTCINVSSFIPQTGKVYEVSQKRVYRGCTLELKEKTTRRAPEGLIVHSVVKSCTANP